MNSQTDHRIYEWKVPLASIHASPGQTIDLSSPLILKFSQTPCTSIGPGSIPYDADTGRDNIWPPDINSPGYVTEDRSDWGLLKLQSAPPERVPTLSEWGLILLCLLLAASACGYLRKGKRWA